jgi:hypothetical protein
MNKPIENKENILKNFKYENNFSNLIKYSIFLIAFLVLLLFYILFKVKFKASGTTDQNSQTAIKDTFIILFFTLLIVTICISILPNFKNLREFFNQISNVTYVIIYTIFLILFFTLTPKNILNDYAYILTPITIFIGLVMFYKSFQQNYVDNFGVNYERIKMMILFFCLLTIYIIYYNIDPGGYIQKTFGYSLLLTIIISVFVFIYLICILTLPEVQKDIKIGDKSSNFLENFSPFLKYNSIAFIIFIIIVTIGISTYPGGFFNNNAVSSFSIILILMIVILWSILLGSNLFSDFLDKNVISSDSNIIKRSMLVLLWIIILSLVIFWLVYNIDNLTSSLSIFKFILNLLLLLTIFGLIYKTINVKLPAGNAKKNAFFSLFINIFLYIPCLVSSFFDWIGKFIAGEYNASEAGTFIMLIISICLLVIYFALPSVFNRFYLQGGKQLINKPVYTDTQYNLGSYIDLNNGNEEFDYQYSISCWVFIDSATPNTNSNYNKYTSLLNFGNKPNVLYNGKTHTLMITMEQKNLKDQTKNKLIDFDENGNRIIYTNNNFLLQKWNNIIINYNGGTMDIFLNGELVKSSIEVVPYYTYDNLVIGENTGIKGGMCNVIYFKRALNSSEIYLLYNLVKNNTPPTLSNTNETNVVNKLK